MKYLKILVIISVLLGGMEVSASNQNPQTSTHSNQNLGSSILGGLFSAASGGVFYTAVTKNGEDPQSIRGAAALYVLGTISQEFMNIINPFWGSCQKKVKPQALEFPDYLKETLPNLNGTSVMLLSHFLKVLHLNDIEGVYNQKEETMTYETKGIEITIKKIKNENILSLVSNKKEEEKLTPISPETLKAATGDHSLSNLMSHETQTIFNKALGLGTIRSASSKGEETFTFMDFTGKQDLLEVHIKGDGNKDLLNEESFSLKKRQDRFGVIQKSVFSCITVLKAVGCATPVIINPDKKTLAISAIANFLGDGVIKIIGDSVNKWWSVKSTPINPPNEFMDNLIQAVAYTKGSQALIFSRLYETLFNVMDFDGRVSLKKLNKDTAEFDVIKTENNSNLKGTKFIFNIHAPAVEDNIILESPKQKSSLTLTPEKKHERVKKELVKSGELPEQMSLFFAVGIQQKEISLEDINDGLAYKMPCLLSNKSSSYKENETVLSISIINKNLFKPAQEDTNLIEEIN